MDNEYNTTYNYNCSRGYSDYDHKIFTLYRFPANKETPKYIKYLGKVLPAAVLGLLVVYSLKDVSVFNDNHAIPEAICIAVIVFLHFWKRQMILSISAGTILYMVLVQSIFK